MVTFDEKSYAWATHEQIVYLHKVLRKMEFYKKDTARTLGKDHQLLLQTNIVRLSSIIKYARYHKGDQAWLNTLRNYLE